MVSALSAGHLSAIQFSPHLRRLYIVRDNDPAGDAATHAHLINFDSVHGRWNSEASSEGECILIDGKRIQVKANKTIADTDWSGCDLVIDIGAGNANLSCLIALAFDVPVVCVEMESPRQVGVGVWLKADV